MARFRILYFHGFASSPLSAKAVALQRLLAGHEIELVVPDLNLPSFAALDFDAIVDFALDVARNTTFCLLAGSSMGSLVALEIARLGINLPLVLIAPAFGLGTRWIERLPDGDPIMLFHYGMGREAPIHRRFFEQMVTVRPEEWPPRSMVRAIMGRLDESVPFEGVENTWRGWESTGKLAQGSRLLAIDEGDHSLKAHVDLIASEIRQTIKLQRP